MPDGEVVSHSTYDSILGRGARMMTDVTKLVQQCVEEVLLKGMENAEPAVPSEYRAAVAHQWASGMTLDEQLEFLAGI